MLCVVNNLASRISAHYHRQVEINKSRVSKLSYSDRDEFLSAA